MPPPPPPLDQRGLPPPRVTFDLRGELPFWIFLAVAAGVFTGGTMLGIYLRPQDTIVRTDLDFLEGIETEPPPLGDPNAGAPAPEPTPTPPEPPKPPKPPEPEPEPEPPPPPPPEPTPEFPKPEEKPPATPPPKPKAVAKPAATPRAIVANPKTAPAGTGSGESDNPNAKPGPKGVPGGVPGGRGGQKGGFISRPDMPIDNMIVSRKYFGRGTARVVCANGSIVSVEMSKSIGFSYCDNKAVQWIRSRWKPAPGTNGTFSFPIIVKP